MDAKTLLTWGLLTLIGPFCSPPNAPLPALASARDSALEPVPATSGTITLDPDSEPLAAGQSVDVCVDGVDATTVTITVQGPLSGQTETLTIEIENRSGCTSWTVPGWPSATLSGDGVASISRSIQVP